MEGVNFILVTPDPVAPEFFMEPEELETLTQTLWHQTYKRPVDMTYPYRVTVYCRNYEDAATITRTFAFARKIQLMEQEFFGNECCEWHGIDGAMMEWKFRWALPTMGYSRGIKGEYAIIKLSMETTEEFINNVRMNHYLEVGVV